MMLGCLMDPGGCIAAGWANLLATVPWWAWLVIALVVIGMAWKLAGWPGLIALALGAGYFARDVLAAYRVVRTDRHENVDGDDASPPPTKPKRRKTLQDLIRDGLR
jgi:hypothetical protein